MTKYLIVIEKGGRNFSAFSPDIPGCVATGATKNEAAENLREAIDLHLKGLEADGLRPPQPHSSARYVVQSRTLGGSSRKRKRARKTAAV